MDWTHRLRLRHVKMLLSLAQTHNISHSAAKLHTTQPGLSKWLKDLEEDIGLPLFERHARGLIPTPYGEMLIAHARQIDIQLDRASSDMDMLREGGSGRVIIGASGVAASDTVPLAIMRLLTRMPKARVNLVEGTTDRLISQLQQGALDIVLGRADTDLASPTLEAENLFFDGIHFVVRPGTRFCKLIRCAGRIYMLIAGWSGQKARRCVMHWMLRWWQQGRTWRRTR